MKKYRAVTFEQSPTTAGFQDEVGTVVNAEASKGWVLKQAMQLRANLFMFLFEAES